MRKAADLIEMELERLDAALDAIWDRAMKGELAAVDRLIQISERRCRLLGLDAPTRVEASGPEGGPIELSGDPARVYVLKLIERYAEKAQAALPE